MGIVTNPKTLERGLRATFVKGFGNGELAASIAPFILETSSDGKDEEYGWLGQAPSMEEWVDERQLKSLIDFDYKLTNKDYEATMPVKRNDIEDDRLGAIQIRVNDLAKKAKIHPIKLFYAALVAGTVDLCYDGQPFFSASHEEGESGTQSNIYTGTGVTLAQLEADFEGCEARMMSFKDDRGEPYDESDIKVGVIVPPALKRKMEKLNTLSMIDNSENGMKGKIAHIASSSRLTDANDWYFANIVEGIKPFIRQVRQAVKFSALEGSSDNGFMRKTYHYGVDSREVFGYGLWQKND